PPRPRRSRERGSGARWRRERVSSRRWRPVCRFRSAAPSAPTLLALLAETGLLEGQLRPLFHVLVDSGARVEVLERLLRHVAESPVRRGRHQAAVDRRRWRRRVPLDTGRELADPLACLLDGAIDAERPRDEIHPVIGPIGVGPGALPTPSRADADAVPLRFGQLGGGRLEATPGLGQTGADEIDVETVQDGGHAGNALGHVHGPIRLVLRLDGARQLDDAVRKCPDLDRTLAQDRVCEERIHDALLETREVGGQSERGATAPPQPPPGRHAGEHAGGDHPSVISESGWPRPQHPVPTPVRGHSCCKGCKSQTREATAVDPGGRGLAVTPRAAWFPGEDRSAGTSPVGPACAPAAPGPCARAAPGPARRTGLGCAPGPPGPGSPPSPARAGTWDRATARGA